MWLIGILVWMSLIAGIIGMVNRGPRSTTPSAHWDIARLSGSISSVVSSFASFSIAAAVFLTNLTRATQSPTFADVMALFLIAFIILMGAAIMQATEPHIQVAWLLLVAILGGGVRMAAWLYSLLDIRFETTASIPIISLTSVALYSNYLPE